MPEAYKHEHRYGPYSAEVLAKFKGHDGKTEVTCVCGFKRKKREQMAKHLNGNKGCFYARIQKYWRSHGYVTVSNGTRLVTICEELGLGLYEDQRAYRKGASSWETWAPEWAAGIFCDYLTTNTGRRGISGMARKDVVKRGLDNNKDWMLRTVLTEARDDEEFRSAIRGMQRLKTKPEDQCAVFKQWLAERGHTIPANIKVKEA